MRRYERLRPGELVHVDVKRLGRIPNGGGHRVLGRAAGRANQYRTNDRGYLFLAAEEFAELGCGQGR